MRAERFFLADHRPSVIVIGAAGWMARSRARGVDEQSDTIARIEVLDELLCALIGARSAPPSKLPALSPARTFARAPRAVPDPMSHRSFRELSDELRRHDLAVLTVVYRDSESFGADPPDRIAVTVDDPWTSTAITSTVLRNTVCCAAVTTTHTTARAAPTSAVAVHDDCRPPMITAIRFASGYWLTATGCWR